MKAFFDKKGKLIIEDAKLLYGRFRNFEGREDRYNREGDRNFCVVIDDPEVAQNMAEDGWNVKILAPRDENEQPTHFIRVKVQFRDDVPEYRNPQVHLHTRRNVVKLTEETIGRLDGAEIITADMVINPYDFGTARDGARALSAYLDTLHVTIEEDYFADKYARDDYPDEEAF